MAAANPAANCCLGFQYNVRTGDIKDVFKGSLKMGGQIFTDRHGWFLNNILMDTRWNMR